MKAPVCAIVGYDLEFYELLPRLFPHTDARNWFAGKPKHIQETAFRNGTLQGAYMIPCRARALGLDCGPMSGFDNAGVDSEFFAGTSADRTLCSLGYGDPAGVGRADPASRSTRWRRSSEHAIGRASPWRPRAASRL